MVGKKALALSNKNRSNKNNQKNNNNNDDDNNKKNKDNNDNNNNNNQWLSPGRGFTRELAKWHRQDLKAQGLEMFFNIYI